MDARERSTETGEGRREKEKEKEKAGMSSASLPSFLFLPSSSLPLALRAPPLTWAFPLMRCAFPFPMASAVERLSRLRRPVGK